MNCLCSIDSSRTRKSITAVMKCAVLFSQDKTAAPSALEDKANIANHSNYDDTCIYLKE